MRTGRMNKLAKATLLLNLALELHNFVFLVYVPV